MANAQVALAGCESYDRKKVGAALDRLIESLGGWGKYIKPGDKVFVKPNLLLAAKPDQAITTHPVVLGEIIRRLMDFGAIVSFGDLPGGYHAANTKKVYRETEMDIVAEETGATLVQLEKHGFKPVDIPGGKIMKRIHVPSYLDEMDALVNVCKLKTHMQARFTGAVKNMFGMTTTQDRLEAHSHAKYEDFSTALAEIFSVLKPTLNFADGVMGMEGQGPSQGKPVFLGLLAASADAVALDVVASTIMGFIPRNIGVIAAAKKINAGVSSMADIAIFGDPVSNFTKKIKPPSSAVAALMDVFSGPFSKSMAVRPFINKNKCKKCGVCAEVCAGKSIKTSGKYFVVEDDKCLLCYCCHELCPHSAVELTKPLVVRLAEFLRF